METEDGVLYLDMKCGNLMQQRISRSADDQRPQSFRASWQSFHARWDASMVHLTPTPMDWRIEGAERIGPKLKTFVEVI